MAAEYLLPKWEQVTLNFEVIKDFKVEVIRYLSVISILKALFYEIS